MDCTINIAQCRSWEILYVFLAWNLYALKTSLSSCLETLTFG